MNDVDKKNKLMAKFIIYMTFFAVIIILAFISNDKENILKISKEESHENVEKIEKRSYKDMQNILINGNYEYEFIVSGTEKVMFIGKAIDGVRTGYKEVNNIKQNYNLGVNGGSIYEKLYLGLDSNLFNFKVLFDNLNRTSTIIIREEKKLVYVYDNMNEYIINIYIYDDYISKIEIKNDMLVYNFSFTY